MQGFKDLREWVNSGKSVIEDVNTKNNSILAIIYNLCCYFMMIINFLILINYYGKQLCRLKNCNN